MRIERIDISILDSLSSLAKRDERLRQNCDLRNSPDDQSQRMLNAVEPGSVVPIHRHRDSSETVVCLRGKLLEMFYDDGGRLTHSIELSPEGPVIAYNITKGQWHSVKSLVSGTVIMECKDGAYSPLAPEDVFEK